MKNKFKKFINKGINEPLFKIPFHRKAPLKRYLMLNNEKIHIAIHHIKNLPKKIPEYSSLHKHNFYEVNLLFSEKSKLIYEIKFENEIYKVSSPASIFIPKKIRHSAKVISGEGTFVCITFTDSYSVSN